MARKLLVEVLPDKYEFISPPYVSDAEVALRQACRKNEGFIKWTASSIAFSPNGEYVASDSNDQTVRIWDVNDGGCIRTMEGHIGEVTSVSFNPNGEYVASASTDKTIRIWDVNSGECVRTMEGHAEVVSSVSFSPNGKYIASASWDGTVRLWEVDSGKCIKTMEGDIFLLFCLI